MFHQHSDCCTGPYLTFLPGRKIACSNKAFIYYRGVLTVRSMGATASLCRCTTSLLIEMAFVLFGGLPGGPELLIILLIIVLLFGANKLPELARSTGQAMGEFQRGREEIERELHQSSAASTTPTATGGPAASSAESERDDVETEAEADSEAEPDSDTDSRPTN